MINSLQTSGVFSLRRSLVLGQATNRPSIPLPNPWSIRCSSTAMPSLLSLPVELHLQIMSYVTEPFDRLCLSYTCRYYRSNVVCKPVNDVSLLYSGSGGGRG